MTTPQPKLLPTQRHNGPVTHGHTQGYAYSPTYQSWQSMLTRCRYKKRDATNKHAGRGIIVCERWSSFSNFLADMGERPNGHTLDRIDNNGNYEPGNCRWTTPVWQARNRRNKKLEYMDAYTICCLMLSGYSAKSIADEFGCSESLPREIAKGRTWKDACKAAYEFMGVTPCPVK